ncbi:hypothetical protein KY346_03000 [Candidatus Woesearchaeota archaeon]|nr:hypothetical protein [Candidatus Woesearchaeota archaeon]
MQKSNKSQMEIMGLVIIVILVAIGMLFAVQFLLKKPAGRETAAVKESTIAANFLNAMLSTTTDCYNRNIRELLQDCALTGGTTRCPGQRNSCDYAADQIRIMLDKTLSTWNKDYYFSIKGAPGVEAISFGNSCPECEREAKIHPVPVRPGFEIQLTLEIYS